MRDTGNPSDLQTTPNMEGTLQISTVEKIIEVTVLVIIDVLSLAGNIFLWIVIMGTPALRTISNYLVLEMSASCILISVVIMPYSAFTIAAGWLTFPDKACLILAFFLVIMYVFSLSILALISFNRYVLVCHYRSYNKVFNKSNSTMMMLGIVVCSALIASPPFLGWGGYTYFPLESLCFFEFESSRSYIPCLLVIVVCGPVFVMVYCYTKIIQALRSSNRKIQASYQQQSIVVVTSSTSGNPPITGDAENGTNLVKQTKSTSPKEEPENLGGNLNQQLKQTLREKEELKLAISFLVVIGTVCISVLPNCMAFLLLISSVPLTRGYTMPSLLMAYSYCFTTPILYMKLNKKYMEAFNRIFIRQQWRKKKNIQVSSEARPNGVDRN